MLYTAADATSAHKSAAQSRRRTAPRLLDAGEAALVVEFGAQVDPSLSDRVLALADALAAASIQGVRECVPTYRSLMIHYNPLVLDREVLAALALELAEQATSRTVTSVGWILPCCYDSPHGEDLAELADRLGMSAAAVVDVHLRAIYRVYMYGFSPGQAYLGGLSPELAVPRRRSPRPPHAAGAVVVGGGLSAVTTVSMPTGWYVVGTTPVRLYAPEREPTFFLSPGDAVQFEPVDCAVFARLSERAADGEIVAQRTGGPELRR
ncbi:KipI family sensor histidine kinase inhibitor [Methylobacterium sp. 1030]